jgi:uncharacterized protein YjiK
MGDGSVKKIIAGYSAMFSLTFLERFRIENKKAGLTEPSGLVLAPGGEGFWTIGDETRRLFRLTADGALLRNESIDAPKKGLEDITIDPAGKHLFAVREKKNEIFKFDIARRKMVERRRLKDMRGYDVIAHHFKASPANKGLEGLTWSNRTGSFFALKEGKPALLIEVSPGLRKIRSHTVLDAQNGFVDPASPGRKVDCSGICFDPVRAAFWIVSDQARRVYHYDPESGRVLRSAVLGYSRNGRYGEIEKAEGIAYDARASRLYVVSDAEARIYTYAVTP